jgi:hypothetical protein
MLLPGLKKLMLLPTGSAGQQVMWQVQLLHTHKGPLSQAFERANSEHFWTS